MLGGRSSKGLDRLTNGEGDTEEVAESGEGDQNGEDFCAGRVAKHILEEGSGDGDVGCEEVGLGDSGELEVLAIFHDESRGTYVGDVRQNVEHADNAHGQGQGNPQCPLGVANLG
jgi:hypothetical protein